MIWCAIIWYLTGFLCSGWFEYKIMETRPLKGVAIKASIFGILGIVWVFMVIMILITPKEDE